MVALSTLTEDDFRQASLEDRKEVAKQAVEKAGSDQERADVATAAVDALSDGERAKLLNSWIPQKSSDKMWVYIAGFTVAAILGIGLALIAWGAADSDNDSIATAIVAAALSLPSAIIGGLLGAFVTRQPT